jgi:carbonic anhydrase
VLLGSAAAALTPSLVAGTAGAATAATATPAAARRGGRPDRVLAKLLDGNRRVVAGKGTHPHQDLDRLHELAEAQHPHSVVIGCADSRVAPELLFDQGIGDVFDNRVAGNIVDDLLLGSTEFAVEEFGCAVVMVLGHERCGAVSATVEALESDGTAPGHIGTIVEALRPVVTPYLDSSDPVERGVRANVRHQVAELTRRSPLLAQHVARGELKVVGARYDLDTGRVKVLG